MTGRPTRKYFSNLDPGGVLKNSHSQEADALRVIDTDNIVGQYWSHVILTYDVNDSVDNAKFYYDKIKGIYDITFVGDTAGSLNSKYFLLNTGQNEKKFYVWYNVGGTGTDPNIVGREGIEIPVAFNDAAEIIALATKLLLNMKDELIVTKQLNGKIKIENDLFGASSISDFNTGFTFGTIQDGVSELVRDYDFPPQTDIKYVYNPYAKTFEVIDTSTIEVTLESSAKSPFVQNIILLNANVESSFALPDDTKRFLIRLRNNDANLKVKYTSGGDFILIPRGTYYEEDNLLTESVTLYFEADSAGKTLELIYWT